MRISFLFHASYAACEGHALDCLWHPFPLRWIEPANPPGHAAALLRRAGNVSLPRGTRTTALVYSSLGLQRCQGKDKYYSSRRFPIRAGRVHLGDSSQISVAISPPPSSFVVVMSHRRNNAAAAAAAATTPTRAPAGQRSYIVSIDAGAFANVEIVVGGHYRGEVWTPSRAASLKATSKSHVYAYGMPTGVSPPLRFRDD